MARTKLVPIATKADGKLVIPVEPGATVGAVVGVNLLLPDGTVLRAEDIVNPPAEDDGGDEFFIWQQIQQIPQNIRELAAITGSGFAWRNPDGTWRLRKIGRQVIDFAYGDASPAVIYTPSANALVVLARVDILTPFDGAGAQIKIGTAADDDLFLSAAQNDPGFAAEYEATPDEVIAAGTDIRITIAPGGGASAGTGRVVLDTIPVEGF